MFLTDLADVARSAGVNVVECPGWQRRGFNGQGFSEVRGVLWHHTAGPRSGNMPSLNVLRDGRPGLAGPLCQLGLARDGTVYVIAAGWANHAGTGTAPGIPRNQGNAYLIGVEMESAGLPPYDWTPAQLDTAPRLGAALERAYLWRLPASQRLQLGHSEYSDAGKIDPAGWPGGMDGLRTQINKALTGAPTTERTWLDMATKDDVKAALREVQNERFDRQGGVGGQMSQQDFFAWFDATMRSVAAQTATATAQAILSTPIKREGNDGTITLATFLAYSDANNASLGQVQAGAVQEAVQKALTDGTVKVDVSVTGGEK